jgi:hypothetical protein
MPCAVGFVQREKFVRDDVRGRLGVRVGLEPLSSHQRVRHRLLLSWYADLSCPGRGTF